MSGMFPTCVLGAFRRTALPLLSYYALTLGVPIANGATVSDVAFVRHAALVLLVPLVAIALAGVAFNRGTGAGTLLARRSMWGGCGTDREPS